MEEDGAGKQFIVVMSSYFRYVQLNISFDIVIDYN